MHGDCEGVVGYEEVFDRAGDILYGVVLAEDADALRNKRHSKRPIDSTCIKLDLPAYEEALALLYKLS